MPGGVPVIHDHGPGRPAAPAAAAFQDSGHPQAGARAGQGWHSAGILGGPCDPSVLSAGPRDWPTLVRCQTARRGRQLRAPRQAGANGTLALRREAGRWQRALDGEGSVCGADESDSLSEGAPGVLRIVPCMRLATQGPELALDLDGLPSGFDLSTRVRASEPLNAHVLSLPVWRGTLKDAPPSSRQARNTRGY